MSHQLWALWTFPERSMAPSQSPNWFRPLWGTGEIDAVWRKLTRADGVYGGTG